MSLLRVLSKIVLSLGFSLVIISFLTLPTAVMAQNGGVDLTNSIGFSKCNVSASEAKGGTKLQECIRSILNFALILAGVVAIVQLGVAAFNYYNPEVQTDAIQDSISQVKNIFIGLMLIAGGVVILATFNTALIDFSFLGFTASTDSTKASSGTTAASSGATSSPSAQQFGNISVSDGNLTQNINSLIQEASKVQAGTTSNKDFTDALNYTLGSLNLNSLTQSDIDAMASLFDSIQKAGIAFTPDPNLLAAVNSSGPNADGSQTKTTASYCTVDACTIKSAAAVGNPQVLTITLNTKNNTPVNFVTTLNPPNQLPSPLDTYLKIKPGSSPTNATFDIIQNSVSSIQFSQWCSIATGGGGTACQNSPATTGDYLFPQIG